MTIWYIAPTGNNTTGDGTEGNPYLTVAKCHTVGANGDTVVCADGQYYENNTTISKTSFTVRAATGAVPVFTTATKYTSWVKTDGYTNVYEAATSQPYGVWNGATYLIKAANLAACDGTTNSWYWSSPKTYVNLGGTDPDGVGGLYCNITANFVFVVSGAGGLIEGITVHWAMRGISLTSASTVRNCSLRYMNQMDGGEWGAVVTGADGPRIEGCTIEHMRDTASGYTAGQAISANTGSANVTVRRCTINCANNGVLTFAGTGHIVEQCVMDKLYRDGVSVDGSSACECRYNTVYDCNGGFLVRDTATANWHHNVVAARSDITTGTGVRWGYIVEGGSTAVVHSNVCANLNAITSTTGAAYLCKGTSAGTFYNNISYNNDAGYAGNAPDTPTLTADYNLSYLDGTAYTASWNGGAAGAHDLAVDPQFRSPIVGAEDFRLLSTSPCIDAGTLVTSVNEGFRGGAPDMGAFEYVKPVTRRREWFASFFDLLPSSWGWPFFRGRGTW